jgi:hypothetical protein
MVAKKKKGGKQSSAKASRSQSQSKSESYNHQDEKIRNHSNRAGDISDSDDEKGGHGVKKADDESIDDSGSECGWDSSKEPADWLTGFALFSTTFIFFWKEGERRKNSSGIDKKK